MSTFKDLKKVLNIMRENIGNLSREMEIIKIKF